MKNTKIATLRKTLKALENATKVDPYKIERFRHQLQLALIEEEKNDD